MLVNLDPANDQIPYKCDLDLRELVSLDTVMREFGLGPNGGLLHCIDTLEANFDGWLGEGMQRQESDYFIFDLPGQVELFATGHGGLERILRRLETSLAFRLATVHLVDAANCLLPSRFLSSMLLSLQCMLHLGCPHLNILSKLDLLETYGVLPLPLEAYVYPEGLFEHLIDNDEDGHIISKRYRQLTAALAELVEDFGSLEFLPMTVEDRESMAQVVHEIDRVGGLIFGVGNAGDNRSAVFGSAYQQDHSRPAYLELMSERYLLRSQS